MATDQDYKKHNVRGAITYSQFTMDQAIKQNDRPNAKFVKKPEDVAPEIQLLLDDVQLAKIVKHLQESFLPETIKRHAAGEKKDAFDKKTSDRIAKALDEWAAGNVADAPPHLPMKSVYFKTLDVAPWAVATLKFTGTKGKDIEQLARVTEDEMKVPDPKLLSFPTLVPIERSVHDLYPGAWAYATLNLSGWWKSATNFGITAYSNTVVFLEDRDRLSGGIGLDQDDIFMDD